MKKVVILISGRGSNMNAIVENVQSGILKNFCEIVEVFSNKPNAEGLKLATKIGLKTFSIASRKQKNYDKLLFEHLKKLNPDFIILAGYMKILNAKIVKYFNRKIINIHPADTKLHQGLDGYKWAFKNKILKTKITVHFVDEGLDSGEIIDQIEVDISNCRTLLEVEQEGLKIEHKFYSECLKKIFISGDFRCVE